MKPPNSLRLLTWNIHGTFGLNPRFDLLRAVELIQRWSPDIIALQEVDSRRAGPNGDDPFELLQHQLGKHGVRAHSITTADGDYGQILISCCPIRNSEVHDISQPEREPRRAIMAEIEAPAGLIRVVATHLGLSIGERRGQARQLLSLAGAGDMPTIVMGDFNDWFWVGSVHAMLAHELPGRSSFRTFPSFCPLLKLDRIFCRPAAVLQTCFCDPLGKSISDHLPVIADITL